VLSGVEHELADLEVGRMDCSHVNDFDVSIVGKALVS
jgi:hypothetical protein